MATPVVFLLLFFLKIFSAEASVEEGNFTILKLDGKLKINKRTHINLQT